MQGTRLKTIWDGCGTHSVVSIMAFTVSTFHTLSFSYIQLNISSKCFDALLLSFYLHFYNIPSFLETVLYKLFFCMFTSISECVLSICTRHPKPTPNSMSEGNAVKDADISSQFFFSTCPKLFFCWHNCWYIYKEKDTENDASKAGGYCHSWVTLSGDGDVRKAIWNKSF